MPPCFSESTLTPHRALAIDVDLDSEVFEDLDPPRGAFEADNPCISNGRAGCQPSVGGTYCLNCRANTAHFAPQYYAQEQQSELAASITHQPWDFSESGPAATIREADPPAESAAMSSGMTQRQPWRHDANAPALPPSPMVEPQSATGLIDVPENLYGSDLEAPAPHDDTESDQDEEASLEDEFRLVSDDGGEDEDMEHGQGASMSGSIHTLVIVLSSSKCLIDPAADLHTPYALEVPLKQQQHLEHPIRRLQCGQRQRSDRKDDVWARFTKSHPHVKPFMSKGFDHFEIMEQLMPNQSKGAHVFRPTTTAVSTSVPPATESAAPSAAPPPAGPPSSINPDSIAPPVPSTYLTPSTEGSTTDSAWTSISRSKRKYSALAPGSATSSQKRSRPPSATLMAQQEGTETMKNLVEVVHEMQKNFTLAPPPLPMPQLVQPGTHVGSAIALLNKYTNLTSKERLSIANFLAEHENQAIIFYSLDEATRLEWLEEKRVTSG
ncbi:uncharacterized protein F5891DRAFT_1187970 [Suillus fuscotomentosus]|uniref:Uncharacterized protein n=1 Tax=Suillus fuscotomentosus TaxID=1912939 RepID=A0AAD4HMH5_9AGAM|nr:uncharacterized protein F5891DRAFT_1187970 [Suillus fuscotomentosus]KAG1900884.1 hypothetical protein F5891DRAFT_1187970 [Suillus fuscotomentosus]